MSSNDIGPQGFHTAATPLDQPKRNSTFTMYLAEAGLPDHATASHDVQNGTEWQWVCLKTAYTLVLMAVLNGENER